MPSLEMNGPHDLTSKDVDKCVTRVSPGNYGLGYVNDKQTFVVQYVGRADSDVNERLHAWVGKKYRTFKYSYASSPRAAFEKECKNYHEFGGKDALANNSHPDRPDGTTWKCPQCDIFG